MKAQNSISIITICFNNKEELLNTLASVDSQLVAPFEHIVIDGSSNSEIKDYFDAHPQPSYRKWICEKDKGISDAFNKGIRRATGDLVNMLNSGDTYYNDTVLTHVHEVFKNKPSINWMHSKFEIKRGGDWIIIGKAFEKEKLYRGMRRVCHQSMFVRKSMHDKHGLYDLNEKISMDYDFLCRLASEPFYFSEKVLAKFIPDGISSTQYSDSLVYQSKVYERYFPATSKTKIWMLRQRILHGLQESPLGNFLFSIKKALKLENW